MPQFCGVLGCGHNSMRDGGIRFFRLPAETNTRGAVDLKKRERRQKWIQALRRADLTETKLKYMRICSVHFSSGEPSADEAADDYIPHLKMGYEMCDSCDASKKLKGPKRKLPIQKDREDVKVESVSEEWDGASNLRVEPQDPGNAATVDGGSSYGEDENFSLVFVKTDLDDPLHVEQSDSNDTSLDTFVKTEIDDVDLHHEIMSPENMELVSDQDVPTLITEVKELRSEVKRLNFVIEKLKKELNQSRQNETRLEEMVKAIREIVNVDAQTIPHVIKQETLE